MRLGLGTLTAQVTFSDETFSDADWTAQKVEDTTPGASAVFTLRKSPQAEAEQILAHSRVLPTNTHRGLSAWPTCEQGPSMTLPGKDLLLQSAIRTTQST